MLPKGRQAHPFEGPAGKSVRLQQEKKPQRWSQCGPVNGSQCHGQRDLPQILRSEQRQTKVFASARDQRMSVRGEYLFSEPD